MRKYPNTTSLLAELESFYDKRELRQIVFMLLEKVTKRSRASLMAEPTLQLSITEEKKMDEAIVKLKNNVPIQQILGESFFHGLSFKVSTDVLIPRPETEELVDWVMEELALTPQAHILDIGTGTGCIAITISKLLPEAIVSAFDISTKALAIAQQNAHNNNVKIDFINENILSPQRQPIALWDAIVSNPPYIMTCEKETMEPHVLEHEPALALFVPDDDPLLFYKAIAHYAQQHLRSGGMLFFEINAALAAETKQVLLDTGFKEVTLRKDFFGKNRFIKTIK